MMAANTVKNSLKNYYINNILNAKRQYRDAVNAGDTARAEALANDNQKNNWYQSLRDSGFNKEAQWLNTSDYDKAAADAIRGKVALRDYLRNMGLAYGLSSDQVDSMLRYNDRTGEVTVGGVNAGTPIELEGVTYMDADEANSIWKNAMKNLGISQTDETRYGQLADDLTAQQSGDRDFALNSYNDFNNQQKALSDQALNQDVMNQPWAQSLMGYYNWNGTNAANGELASGAGSNGGNIDSFAAANAARQQLALTNAGVNAVAQNWLQRLGVAQNDLEMLGNQRLGTLDYLNNNLGQGRDLAQQIFDNSEARKNNAADRDYKQAQTEAVQSNTKLDALERESDITGYIPTELERKNNQYFNSDTGEMLNANRDYMEIINTAREKLKDVNISPEERRGWEKTLRDATLARLYKVNVLGYDDQGIPTPSLPPELTASMRESDAERNLTRYQTDKGAEMAAATAANEAAANQAEQEYKWAELTSNAYADQAKLDQEREIAEAKLNQERETQNANLQLEYDKLRNNGNSNSQSQKRKESFLDNLNKYAIEQIGETAINDSGALKRGFSEMFVNQLKKDTTLTDDEKFELIEQFGISADMIDYVTYGRWYNGHEAAKKAMENEDK